MTTYDLRNNAPSTVAEGDILNAPYSGSYIGITLMPGTYRLEVWGAQGGYRSDSQYGGKGGYSVGDLTLKAQRTVYLYAGGSGNTGKTSGGFNGGGARGTYNGGGGGSDIRLGTTSLGGRVIIAGGGGSDGSANRAGGAGGGESGQDYQGGGFGTNNGAGKTDFSGSSWSTTASSRDTTTTGSSTAIFGGEGFGGTGQGPYNGGYGGAGGGGWYGGSGTLPDSSSDDDKAGSGGSGYIYTRNATIVPIHLTSDDYLSNASTIDGTNPFMSPSGSTETGHAGDGYCRITVLELGKARVTWRSDGVTLRTDEVEYGSKLPAPPEIHKDGYYAKWTVNGSVVNLPTYTVQSDTTVTAVWTRGVTVELMCKIWDGDDAEYFTWLDMNRVTYNANIVAEAAGVSTVSFLQTTRASQFRYDEAQKLENLLKAVADKLSIAMTIETAWSYNRTLSYVDFERWESNFWAVYKALGGVGERIPAEKFRVNYTAVIFQNDWKMFDQGHYIILKMPTLRKVSDVVVFVSPNASAVERAAECSAMLHASIPEDGILRINAYSVKPHENIPIVVAIGGLQMQENKLLELEKWEGSGPWTQTVTLDKEPSTAVIGATDAMTEAEVEEMTKAIISASHIDGKAVTVRAIGRKPTIDMTLGVMYDIRGVE